MPRVYTMPMMKAPVGYQTIVTQNDGSGCSVGQDLSRHLHA